MAQSKIQKPLRDIGVVTYTNNSVAIGEETTITLQKPSDWDSRFVTSLYRSWPLSAKQNGAVSIMFEEETSTQYKVRLHTDTPQNYWLVVDVWYFKK